MREYQHDSLQHCQNIVEIQSIEHRAEEQSIAGVDFWGLLF